VDAEETGRNELAVYSRRIYTSDRPEFPQIPICFSTNLNQIDAA